jgi:hypothetical protein
MIEIPDPAKLVRSAFPDSLILGNEKLPLSNVVSLDGPIVAQLAHLTYLCVPKN